MSSRSDSDSRENRKQKNDEEANKLMPQNEGHGKLIVAHYNSEDKGYAKRNTSRILHLRNFNNWIKSMLIEHYLQEVKHKKVYGDPINVLDICCGKGGDLIKWKIGNIRHLVCCDIAPIAVENCEKRYRDMRQKNQNIYSAEFITADVTKCYLRKKYRNPSIRFDLVSCQFALHYSFESLPQAECMMKNVTDCLRKGGYFIGTIPCANSIVSKQQKSSSNSFGNDIFNIKFENNVTETYPLFGAKYNFHLDGVVDCPEFLIYFPMLEKLAEKYNLKLVTKKSFQKFFDEKKRDGKFLMNRMSALETYYTSKGDELAGKKSDYQHIEDYFQKKDLECAGTLSEPEWEVTSVYLVFAFQKT